METYIYSILSAIKNNLLSIVSVRKKKKKKEKLDFILFIVCFLSLPGFDRPFFQIQIFLEEYFFNCLRSIENIRNGRLIRCTDKMHVKKKRIKKAIYEVNLVFLFFFFLLISVVKYALFAGYGEIDKSQDDTPV